MSDYQTPPESDTKMYTLRPKGRCVHVPSNLVVVYSEEYGGNGEDAYDLKLVAIFSPSQDMTTYLEKDLKVCLVKDIGKSGRLAKYVAKHIKLNMDRYNARYCC